MSTTTEPPVWCKEATRKVGRSSHSRRSIRVEHELEIETESATYHQVRSKIWGAIPRLSQALEQHDLPEQSRAKILTSAFDRLCEVSEDVWANLVEEARHEFGRASTVTALPAGSVTYQLRESLMARISPRNDHDWDYTIEQFAPRFVGVGHSIHAAERDFVKKVHSAFQSLVQQRPFRMDEEQKATWEVLARLIDVDEYWKSVPLTLIEVGVLSSSSTDRWTVVWLVGTARRRSSLTKAHLSLRLFR